LVILVDVAGCHIRLTAVALYVHSCLLC